MSVCLTVHRPGSPTLDHSQMNTNTTVGVPAVAAAVVCCCLTTMQWAPPPQHLS